MIVFDTSSIIELDKMPTPERIALIEQNDVVISTATAAEFLVGANRRDQVKQAEEFLAQFKWHDVTPNIARKAAEVQAGLMKKGLRVDFADILIAATGHILGAEEIISENQKHFSLLYPSTRKLP